jgi:hypothetical protein
MVFMHHTIDQRHTLCTSEHNFTVLNLVLFFINFDNTVYGTPDTIKWYNYRNNFC